METIPKLAQGGLVNDDSLWVEHHTEDISCEIVSPLNNDLLNHIKSALYDNGVRNLTVKVVA